MAGDVFDFIFVDFLIQYYVRNKDKSGTLINKDDCPVGYQLTLSIHDYSNVQTYLLEDYFVLGKDDPNYVKVITPSQLNTILDLTKM